MTIKSNGFSYEDGAAGPAARILVAGGIGVAPLVFLAQKLSEDPRPKTKDHRPYEKSSRLVLLGAPTKKELLCEKDFKKLGWQVKVATEDGSKGDKGRVTDLLKRTLRRANSEELIYYCVLGLG